MEPLYIGSPRRSKKVSRRAVWAAGGLLASIVVVFFFLSASTPRSAYAEESVTFFVVGDWGREGTFNQTKVATLMDDLAIVEKPRAVISGTAVGATAKRLGWAAPDTPVAELIYSLTFSLSLSLSYLRSRGQFLRPRIEYIQRPAIRTVVCQRVQRTWAASRAMVRRPRQSRLWGRTGEWCVSRHCCWLPRPELSLSLHVPSFFFCSGKLCDDDEIECDRGPHHQLGESLRRRDSRWNLPEPNYVQSFGDGLVDVFFLDTSPWISEYLDTNQSPWNRNVLVAESWRESLSTLDRRLSASSARVKLLVGHHPTRSNGDHGDNLDLVEHLEPLLNEHGVKVYFSGHDHDLEHLKTEDMGFHQVVSGAGSDCARGLHGTDSSVWQYTSQGFVIARVNDDGTVSVRFFTVENGKHPAHEFITV